VYVSDIVVAKGISEFRNKFLTTGKFSSSRIVFDVNEATIKPTSHGILKEIATVINQTDSIKVMIVGHTDNDGSSDLNLILSKKRSEAVKNYLVNALGVSASKILTDGKGASEPITNNASSESKAQNRRVEFIKL
ncbi:MAG: OmpA family protein, partial [Chitinophagaceae bacterium]